MDKIEYPQLNVFQLIDSGADLTDIYKATIQLLASQPESLAISLYVKSATDNSILVEHAFHGHTVPPLVEENSYVVKEFKTGEFRKSLQGNTYFFPSINLGIMNGGLAVETTEVAPSTFIEICTILGRVLGHLTEHQGLSKRLQHFIDRLHILNNLHQLIASNVSLTRIVRNVIHEAAFRFGADIGLLYVLSQDHEVLELKGGYGCPQDAVTQSLPRYEGLAAQVLNSGSHLSSLSINEHSDQRLPFASDQKIQGVDVGCLEVRGEALGIIILGFKSRSSLNPEELGRFEELSRMAAVAISNAQNQERIKAYTERLEDLVRIRTHDLTIQTEKAKEANRAKSRFLANMSHELRTPLTAIVGYSSILIDGLFGEMNPKQIEALQAVVRSSEHLKELIDDVLNLARIESGKEEPEPTHVPIGELIPYCCKIIQQQAVDKGLSFVFPSIPEEIIGTSIFADQKHVHQALINLLSNAVKYTPKGGRVWMTVKQDKKRIIIGIHDTGVGIPPEKQDKLFERFERGDDPYSRQQEGTGIGLNLTRKLIHINNGQIWVESEIGKGSNFYLGLPTATVEATRESLAQKQETKVNLRLDGLYGIIVDDNEATRSLLTLILEGAGASAQSFSNAADTMEEIKNGKIPDFVLTDLSMPEISGCELIQWVRNRSKIPKELPIIVLSACAYEEDRDHAADAGASFFIAKPFRPSEIITAIRSLTISAAIKRQRNLNKT